MKRTLLFSIVILTLWIGCKDDNEIECTEPPTVSAGEDQTLSDQTSATLSGTTTGTEGTWTIVSGAGGAIHDGDPTTFSGKLKTTYTLKFESTNTCGTSSDLINITFNKGCGADQTAANFVNNIHWIEQACFRIETPSYTIYTDPNSITTKDTADIIVITHPHTDHWSAANLDLLTGPNTILIAPQEVEYSGTIGKRIILKPGEQHTAFGCVTIKAVPAYNIVKTQYHPKANNWVGYVITMNGVTIYHAGDTERVPEMKTITCDIAMLPLGQTYTFDEVEEAVEAAKDVKAKIAIPMHFGLYEGTADDAVQFKTLLDGVIPVVIKVKGE